MSEEKKEEGENKEKQEEEEAIQEEEKEEKLVIMKKGDYNVHILIEEVKNLIEVEEGCPPVPRVKVTVFGKDKRTSKVKKPVDCYIYNEHFYFDKTNLTAEMLDSEKVLIEVYDTKHSKKKDYYGIYELDFSYIYNQEGHALHNVWIGLSNPESDDISKIRGYLKISISVLHEGDQRIELVSVENEISNCIIPSQIKMTYKQISLYFFRGEEFPDMDADEIENFPGKIFGQKRSKACDGYIEVKYMGVTRKTSVVKMNKDNYYNIEWNEIIDIPATNPPVSQKIILVVKDKDNPLKGDDIVGSIELNIYDIYAHKYDNFQYLNIYGSPVNKKGDIYDLVNYNAEIGSSWNGRILMKCVVSDVGSPSAKVRKIPNEMVEESKNISVRNNEWKILIKVMSAMYLPDEKDKKSYSVRFHIQDKSCHTQFRQVKNGCIEFNDESLNVMTNTASDKEFELPDLFIYLQEKKSGKNVCFQRIKASEFHLKSDVVFIKLFPDPFVKECKSMMNSGIVKCKICVYDIHKPNNINFKEFQEEDGDLEDLGKEELDIKEDKVKLEKFTVAVVIHMSKGLISTERSGVSDPYVTLKYRDQTVQSSVKNNTMNGIWNEKRIFTGIEMDLKDNTTWPVFQLGVYDYNTLKDEPMGYNYVWLCNSSYTLNDTQQREPKWHKLFLPKSNKQQGQILLSFYIFDSKNEYLANNINTKPDITLYNFEINILGLRQLKPCGIISVKKPFIKFDLNSLNITGKPEDAHANITTIPCSGGANPTINSVIKFEVKLPNKDIYLPELQCEVYDHMLAGLHNPLLGVFSLNLKHIIKKTRRQIDEDISSMAGAFGKGTLDNFFKKSLLKADGVGFYNLIKNTAIKNGMSEKTDNIKEEENNIVNKKEEKNNLIDIKNMDDPLSELKEVEEREIGEKKLTDISKEINKKEEKKEGEEDEESDKDSVDNLLEEQKEKEIDLNKINIDELQVNIPASKKSLKTTVRVEVKKSLNDSHYFVSFPVLKLFKIPGYESKKKKEEENKKEEEGKVEIIENGGNDKLEKIEEEKEEIKPPEQMEKLVNDNNIIKPKENGQLDKIQEVPGVGEEDEEKEKTQKEFYIEDTSKAPSKEFYYEVGYLLKVEEEIKPEESTKHYRRIYGCPLEYCEELNMKSPFNVRRIRRGKYVDKVQKTFLFDALKDIKSKILYRYSKEQIIDDASSQSSKESEPSQVGFLEKKNKDEKYYGKFKGLIRIVEHKKQEEFENKIKDYKEKGGGMDKLKNLNKYENLQKQLIIKQKIIVRVYILEMLNLARRDLLSDSDPYIKILLNDKEVINERKNYQEDQKDCKWFKYYDIPAEIPGSSSLTIEAWDWDEILSDDLIGSTTIDLEDRYYNEDWIKMKYKPIETRPLIHPDMEGSQGKLIMWLEMFEEDKKAQNIPWKIDPQPTIEFQVRLVIWETEDMEIMDIEGTSDIYVIGYIDQKESQKTDIHFRCQTGVGSFNWRMLLPLKLPIQRPTLTIQVYDKDIFSSDDYMCGATINMKDIVNIPKLLDMPVSLTSDFYADLSKEEKETLGEIEFLSPEDDEDGIKFWVQCYKGRKESGVRGEKSGRVMCSLEIFPKKIADLDVVGKGREEPNVNPYLPPPVGRIQFTLNPFKMMNQCVGPKFRKKCYFYCLLCLVIIYLIFTLPDIISSAIF